MLYVTKIKMNPGHLHSTSCEDIESMHLKGTHGETYQLKETIHAFLGAYPGAVTVDCKENPVLEAVTSPTGIQYVRTKDCQGTVDPLMKLPKVSTI